LANSEGSGRNVATPYLPAADVLDEGCDLRSVTTPTPKPPTAPAKMPMSNRTGIESIKLFFWVTENTPQARKEEHITGVWKSLTRSQVIVRQTLSGLRSCDTKEPHDEGQPKLVFAESQHAFFPRFPNVRLEQPARISGLHTRGQVQRGSRGQACHI